MTTAAGTLRGFGSSGNGGPGTRARNGYVMNLASDGQGGVYVSDRSFYSVRRVLSNGTITLVAGGAFGSTGDGGPATLARLAATYGAAPDTSMPGNGGLFIADTGNHVIRYEGSSHSRVSHALLDHSASLALYFGQLCVAQWQHNAAGRDYEPRILW